LTDAGLRKEGRTLAENSINSALLRRMFLSAAAGLELNKEWINTLNVFPVPDGDTGTNMTLTILSAAKEVTALPEQPEMKDLCKAISSGSLRGARGNSGVILSQLFRGFTKEIRQYDELDIPILTNALVRATETAYKAVMKPKEGTILTVARGISDKAQEISGQSTDLETFIRTVIDEGDRVLATTPDLLPVLKQAGVVDSGGQGLMQVLKGALAGYLGEEVVPAPEAVQIAAGAAKEGSAVHEPQQEVSYGYSVEFLLKSAGGTSVDEARQFSDFLGTIGQGAAVIAENGLRIHVHTNDPGSVLQKATAGGQITDVRVSNLRELTMVEVHADVERLQADMESEKKAAEAEEKPEESRGERSDYGFISVSCGEGLSEIFRSLGVNEVIEGGQTMNPSTDDMLNAIDRVWAKNVFILPNNSNIILAASQAKELAKDCNVFVIPTKNVPQGVTAMINFSPESSMEENAEVMTDAISAVKCGQITYAVRDTVIDGVEVHKDDYIGLDGKRILADGQDLTSVAVDTVKALADADSEIVSIYTGCDITEELVNELKTRLEAELPGVEIEVNQGGQPIYYYIVSVE
jgi:DAK2 domain fusion protein YloV